MSEPTMTRELGVLELLAEQNRQILERLERLEKVQSVSIVKEAYTVEEVAERVGRHQWTVRQWCNKGLAKAKKVHGKGRTGEWRISHEELLRLQAEGPLKESPGRLAG